MAYLAGKSRLVPTYVVFRATRCEIYSYECFLMGQTLQPMVINRKSPWPYYNSVSLGVGAGEQPAAGRDLSEGRCHNSAWVTFGFDSVRVARGRLLDILRGESRRARDAARRDEARESERASEGATGYRMWRTGSSKHRHAACNLRRRGSGGGSSERCLSARSVPPLSGL